MKKQMKWNEIIMLNSIRTSHDHSTLILTQAKTMACCIREMLIQILYTLLVAAGLHIYILALGKYLIGLQISKLTDVPWLNEPSCKSSVCIFAFASLRRKIKWTTLETATSVQKFTIGHLSPALSVQIGLLIDNNSFQTFILVRFFWQTACLLKP